ncbi:hypothetical protein PENSPDRAFT_642000 [Peniophora sp. CONT]|nr:hypothetical protein PENSPDRAFT_642000 [Peniophora sp. CONT]
MSRFASRTAFDLLAVDNGDDAQSSEDELAPEPETTPSAPAEPVKPTKTAQRKAAKAARLAKKLERANSGSSAAPSASASPLPSAPAELPSAPEPPLVPVAKAVSKDVPSALDVTPATVPYTNGHVPAPDVETSAPESPAESEPDPITEAPTAPARPAPAAEKPVDGQAVVPVEVAPKHKSEPPAPASTAADAEKKKKLGSIVTRTIWTFIMIGGFIGCLLMGHVYMIMLVMLCQTLVYREVTRLFMLTDIQAKATDETRERDVWSKTLSWYFFAVANYFLYGESIIYYFKHVVFADANLLPFATNHRIVSFSLYTIGFMGFVMSLQKGYLQQQFGLFCWVHMSLLLVVVSSHFIMNNILEGLIWFWVPASLVICNDIFAYIWGMSIGRTPLISLSPKKTVEGFVGAFISTVVFSIGWGTYFARFDYMICPVHDLGVNAWSGMACEPNPVFVWRDQSILPPIAAFLNTILPGNWGSISYTTFQIHLVVFACFASLVAPFGGFFASGFKRAFNIKDFGHSIPGHGGMTDRMDCQFLMGVFTYVYYTSLIRTHHVSVGSVLQTIVSGLTFEEQLELMRDLKHYLVQQGVSVKL